MNYINCTDIDGFEHHALFATAIRNARDGISLVALYPEVASEDSTRLVWANDAFYEIFRISPAEMLDCSLSKLRGEETDLDAIHGLHSSVLHGRSHSALLKLKRGDGRLCIVEVKAEPVEERGDCQLALCLFIDRTEQIEAVERQERVEAKHRALVSNSSDIFTLIDEKGTITYQSSAVQEMLGYTTEELAGTSAFALIHPEDEALARAEFQHVLTSKQKRTLPPLRVLGKGQPVRWFEVVARNHLDDKDVAAIVLTSRDISDRIAMQEKIVIQDRLASLGLLAAGMAHELNNPLSYVISNVEYSVQALISNTEQAGQTREVQEALSEALHGAMRIQQIVQDLRSYVKSGDADHACGLFQLEDALRSALSISANRFSASVDVRIEPGDTSHIYGSEGQMTQVCLNLLMNAADACSAADVEEPKIIARTVSEDDSVYLLIEDNGCGISVENRNRVFEPFFSTKKDKGGTGLGLFICHQIVTSMGGAISFESRTGGRGTLFKIRLPDSALSQPISVSPAGRARIRHSEAVVRG